MEQSQCVSHPEHVVRDTHAKRVCRKRTETYCVNRRTRRDARPRRTRNADAFTLTHPAHTSTHARTHTHTHARMHAHTKVVKPIDHYSQTHLNRTSIHTCTHTMRTQCAIKTNIALRYTFTFDIQLFGCLCCFCEDSSIIHPYIQSHQSC